MRGAWQQHKGSNPESKMPINPHKCIVRIASGGCLMVEKGTKAAHRIQQHFVEIKISIDCLLALIPLTGMKLHAFMMKHA